jgi:cobalt/nickel transport system permease protein
MKQAFHLFSDYFSRRDNSLRRLDVRVKMAISAMLFCAVLGSTQVYLPLLLWCIAWIGLALLRIPLRIIFSRFLPPLLVALVLLVFQALVTGHTPFYNGMIGSWTFTFKEEGFTLGLLQGSRILGAVGVLLLLSSVTPAHEFFLGLRWCRFPKVWVEIALMMYRYLFVFLEEASELLDAQRLRLGYGSPRTAILSAGSLVGAVMVRSIEQSTRTHEAMLARGYTGDYPFGRLNGMKKRDLLIFVVAVILVVSLYLCVEKGLLLW